MPFYRDHIYPRLVNVLGDPKPIQQVRQRVIPLAKGDVLEIGAACSVLQRDKEYRPAEAGRYRANVQHEPSLRLPLLIGNSNERTKLWFSAG